MLKKIVDEINNCLDNELYIAALALALTLPDICGKAEYPNDGIATRYIQWYNDNIGVCERPSSPYSEDMPYSSGEVIYNLRNSLLHQGTPNIEKEKIKDERCVIDDFVLCISDDATTDLSGVSYGKNMAIVKRELIVNLKYLCNNLTKAAIKYYDDNKTKFNFFNYKIEDERTTNY